MKEKHSKHPSLVKPHVGAYHRLEFGIYGTTCDEVERFVNTYRLAMPEQNILYIDADHHAQSEGIHLQVGEKQFHSDKLPLWNKYHDQLNLPRAHGVLVNGNHYSAAKQIIILNDKKRESLERRVEQLTDVWAVLLTSETQKMYPFVAAKINKNTLILTSESELIDRLGTEIKSQATPVKALVLAGGQSKRMGTDKSQIVYRDDKTQEVLVAEMCLQSGMDTFISKNHLYPEDEIQGIGVIKDRLINMGPFGAIISAFITDPNAAWLVVACDLPYLQVSTLQNLLTERDHSKIATAYRIDEQAFPEPLITIYEPSAYPIFLQFMTLGYSCPRKVLINSDIKQVLVKDQKTLSNVNTPEEKDEVNTKGYI